LPALTLHWVLGFFQAGSSEASDEGSGARDKVGAGVPEDEVTMVLEVMGG
jgi:hypothetical protein